MAAHYGLWVWEDGGPFYGVSIHNYVGWFVVAFISYTAHGFHLKQERVPSLQDAPKRVRVWSIAPLLMYGFCAVVFVVVNYEGSLGLVSFYAIGIPFLAALWAWMRWFAPGLTEQRIS